jgi:hypothetical protein
MFGISGVSLVAGTLEQSDQDGRLLDMLVDGLRYGRPAKNRRRAARRRRRPVQAGRNGS